MAEGSNVEECDEYDEEDDEFDEDHRLVFDFLHSTRRLLRPSVPEVLADGESHLLVSV